MASTTKQIHPDIPTDRAWQTGRRLYVRCGYHSRLNDGLRKLGAHWDPEQRALWIGSTKREAVVDLLLTAEAHRNRIEEIKKQDRWVSIPYDAAIIRERAKKLGGIFDRDRKEWALPSDETAGEINELLSVYWKRIKEQREAEKKALEERYAQDRAAAADARQQEKRDAAARAARLREQVIADSGRTTTGETATLVEISTRFMNKTTANEKAYQLGAVIQLDDGRRGIIVARDIWFTNSDMASSVCWHAETHDEAHWDFRYELAIVEPTEEELDAEVRKAAERMDAAEIHAVVDNADKLTSARADDQWTTIAEEDKAGEVIATSGIAAVIRGGQLVLTRDGRVVWQHPGYYDDYIRSEGISSDPELVDRVRALLEAGSRKRVVPGQMPVYYEVKVFDE